jgi:hypothetical protein
MRGRGTVLVGLVLATCLPACAADPGGISGGEGEGPDSIAVRAFRGSPPPPSPPDTDIEPGVVTARWGRVGRSMLVTAWGSGSCPTVPVAIDVDPPPNAVITLVLSDKYEGVCTSDLGPYTSLVRLPEPFTVHGPVELVVENAGEPTVRITL